MDLREIAARMEAFVREKGWYAEGSAKPQTPRNLATSVVIEAAELLECFQWQDPPDTVCVANELADVILYATQIANVMKIDLEGAVADKLQLNQRRVWPKTPAGDSR